MGVESTEAGPNSQLVMSAAIPKQASLPSSTTSGEISTAMEQTLEDASFPPALCSGPAAMLIGPSEASTFLTMPADLSFLYDPSHTATQWLLGPYVGPEPFDEAIKISHILEVSSTRVTINHSNFTVNSANVARTPTTGQQNYPDSVAVRLDELALLEYEVEPSANTSRLALGHIFGVQSHLASIGPIPEFPVAPGEPQPELCAPMTRRFAHFLGENGANRISVSRLGKGVFVVVVNGIPSALWKLPRPDGLAAESALFVIYDARDGVDGAFGRCASVVTSSLSCFGWGCHLCNPKLPPKSRSRKSQTCSHSLLRGLKSFEGWSHAMKEYSKGLNVDEQWTLTTNFLFRRADNSTGRPAIKVKLSIPIWVGYDRNLASQTQRARNLVQDFFDRSRMLYSEPKIGEILGHLDGGGLQTDSGCGQLAIADEAKGAGDEGAVEIRCRLGCNRVFGRAQER